MTVELPDDFGLRLERIVGPASTSTIIDSITDARPLAVRVHGDESDVQSTFAELDAGGFQPVPVDWHPTAFLLLGGDRATVQELDSFVAGRLWIQSLSSMAAVVALEVEPGHDVLDLCAAPGSKTSMLRAAQQGRGILVANDRSRQRLFKLRATLERFGFDRVEITCGPGEAYGASHPECFDRVLVDAPCSGEGMLHASDPSGLSQWSEGRIRRLARQQAGLLTAALRTLRPGGCCVYSTCTYAPEENEQVVDRVLRRLGGEYELEPLPESMPRGMPGLLEWNGTGYDDRMAHCLRLVPGMEPGLTGFFIARIRRMS